MKHIAWIALFFIFFVMSILSFVQNGTIESRKRHIKFLFFILLVYAILYVPATTADIYRYTESIKYIKMYGGEALLNRRTDIYENSIVFYYIMRFLALFPTWLFYPLCVAITYGIPLYIFYDVIKKEDVFPTEYTICVVFFICCVNFGIVTSIVRYFIAYMIGILGIYLWYTKEYKLIQKIVIIGLIILPVFIHASGFYLVCVWLISLLCKFNVIKKLSILLVAITAFSEKIVNLAVRIFGSNQLVNFIINKYERYSTVDYEKTFSRTGMVYLIIMFVILCISIWARLSKSENEENEDFNNMYFVLVVMTTAMLANSTVFYRMIQVSIALTPTYLVKNRILTKVHPGVLYLLLFLSFGVLVYYSRFGTYYYL